MTGYLVRRLADRQVWTGTWDGWSAKDADARVFEFMSVAVAVSSVACAADPLTVEIEPTFVADPEEFALGRAMCDCAALLAMTAGAAA